MIEVSNGLMSQCPPRRDCRFRNPSHQGILNGGEDEFQRGLRCYNRLVAVKVPRLHNGRELLPGAFVILESL